MRTAQQFAFVIFLTMLCSNAFAQFKWIDADGRTHYGDNPPRDAQQVERLSARGSEGDPLANTSYELRRAAERFPITLYTTKDCPPCDAGRDLLKARGIPYAERTISSQEEAEALRKLGGGTLLPILAIGRQLQQQFEANTWHGLLDAAQYPRTSQLPRGYQGSAPEPLIAKPAAAAAPADEKKAQ